MERGHFPMVLLINKTGNEGAISRITLVICGLAISFFLAWLYVTHFYYHQPAYQLGTRNETGELLRDVTITLSPTGLDFPGSMAPGQQKNHMDPPWPVPEAIILTFSDASDSNHKISLQTGLAKSYRGEITVMIWKTNDAFGASLNLGAQEK